MPRTTTREPLHPHSRQNRQPASPYILFKPGESVVVWTEHTVTGIDAAGQRQWTWPPQSAAPDGAAASTDPSFTAPVRATADTVLVHGLGIGTTSDPDEGYVVALGPATGQVRWRHEATHISLLEPDLVVLDHGATQHAVDPVTGTTRWQLPTSGAEELRRIGPWLAVRAQEHLRLVEPDTGEVVTQVEGQLRGQLRAADGRWLLALADWPPRTDGTPGEDPVSEVRILALEPDGEVAWQTLLGEFEPQDRCCPLEAQDGLVAAQSEMLRHLVDPGSGELVDVLEQQADTMAYTWQPDEHTWIELSDRRLRLRSDTEVVVVHGAAVGYRYLPGHRILVANDGNEAMAVRFPSD